MAIFERRHLGRQEEAVIESGVQIRPDEPATPAEGQTWINYSQNKLKTYANGEKVVLAQGHIGAALEVPVSGILDLLDSTSFFKNVLDNYEITAFANFREGELAYLKITNDNFNVVEITDITMPAPINFANGSYFNINSANNANKYYVWVNFDGMGVDPAVGGRTGVEVASSAGLPEISTFSIPSAASISSGQYFTFNLALDSVAYYLWFNKDGLGGDPLIGGKTGIQVTIVTGEAANDIAIKVQQAIDAIAGISASVLTNVVTTTNDLIGTCTDAANVNVSGLTVGITQQGKVAETAPQLAISVAAALNSLAGFSVPVPVTATMTVTNADFGFTDDASDGNMASTFAVNVTQQGSGQINVSFPANAAVDPILDLVVAGQTEQIFILFRSGAYVYVGSNGVYAL